MAPADRRRGPRHGSPRGPRATRRNRLVLAGALVASIAIVAAWFPAADLVHERTQLDAVTASLRRIDAENAALHAKTVQLESPASVARIAREQYGLVAPGDQAYQVLPPSSVSGVGGAGGEPPAEHGARAESRTAASGGFTSRVVRTLEFWR